MFTAALFTAAKMWKQPKYPSAWEWVREVWDMHTVIRKSKIMPFAATWMDPEIVTLRGVRRTQRDKYRIILLMCGIEKGRRQTYLQDRVESRMWKANMVDRR